MTKFLLQTALADEELQAPCKWCDLLTFHQVVSRLTDSDDETPIVHDYEIIACMGCNTVSFRQNWYNSNEPTFHGDKPETYKAHAQVFPPRMAGTKILARSELLPSKIFTIYLETHAAFCADLAILCGIGIRAIVDAVCAEKGAEGRNLEVKIDRLVELHVLAPPGAKILHGTRLLGNLAAHEVEPPDATQLAAAMTVIENLLQGVFIIPHLEQHLPQYTPSPKKTGAAG